MNRFTGVLIYDIPFLLESEGIIHDDSVTKSLFYMAHGGERAKFEMIECVGRCKGVSCSPEGGDLYTVCIGDDADSPLGPPEQFLCNSIW